MELPPPLSSRPPAARFLLAVVLPAAFGAITGVMLGVSEIAYLVLSLLGIGGGYFAGLEHRGAGAGARRGVLGGALFGAFILIAHAVAGAEAKAELPHPEILLVVITTVFGVGLGALGGRRRAKRERRDAQVLREDAMVAAGARAAAEAVTADRPAEDAAASGGDAPVGTATTTPAGGEMPATVGREPAVAPEAPPVASAEGAAAPASGGPPAAAGAIAAGRGAGRAGEPEPVPAEYDEPPTRPLTVRRPVATRSATARAGSAAVSGVWGLLYLAALGLAAVSALLVVLAIAGVDRVF